MYTPTILSQFFFPTSACCMYTHIPTMSARCIHTRMRLHECMTVLQFFRVWNVCALYSYIYMIYISLACIHIYDIHQSCMHTYMIPPTEEIGLKIIAAATNLSKFSREPPYISNKFLREFPEFQTSFHRVNGVLVGQKIYQED